MNVKIERTIILLLLTVIMLAIPVLADETEVQERNLAPVAENLELTTYKGVGLSGNLVAVDPEGDFMDFQIVKSPKKGEVELDETVGSFTYTPYEGKKGKDTFTYVAVDAIGNISEEATVTIRIEKQSSKVSYSDMEGHEANYAALTLAEKDIFVGEQIGGSYFFNPDTLVTRGEFLAMCLKLTDTELLGDIVRTGFADDEDINDWLKPYVSTALVDGIIKGYKTSDGSTVFNPNAEITMSEAAVMLNNALKLSNAPVSGNILTDINAPLWAFQATVNLSACGIASFENEDVYTSTLTRADTAQMLLRASDILEMRSTETASLLSWAA